MKLLDTTFLVDFLRGKPETKKIIEQEEILLTTQINMFEVLVGMFYKNEKPEKFLKTKFMFSNIRVLPIEDMGIIRAAKISGDLMQTGKMIDDCDCLIAGIALSNKVSTIVTRNKKHFSRIEGIKVETY